MRLFIIGLFFLLQLYCIVTQLQKETKLFNWAMYHTNAHYSIAATINGTDLTDETFFARYRFKRRGSEGRSMEHIKRKITQYERWYGTNDTCVILIQYRENLKPKSWHWSNR
ncbi:MAG: hypothetical protein ACTHMM_06015 [Agriterribacter sp.]